MWKNPPIIPEKTAFQIEVSYLKPLFLKRESKGFLVKNRAVPKRIPANAAPIKVCILPCRGYERSKNITKRGSISITTLTKTKEIMSILF
ncbi:MAG TPA: hypothetical protein PLW37_06930 [bacterium]|nr:hypothetical protein [bacterium]HOG43033.1 hypothetical protein [bacterium]HPV21918.1 hypothetical protein [bacterium]HPY15919.1 hypothetical protein [bacterium]HQB09583.1 hypothetical protein [bacterium]